MKITQIKPSKLHLNCVCFEDGENVLIDKDVCVSHSLMVDCEIDNEFLEQLRFESDYVRAKSRALWYLDRMDYSEKALYNKLVEKGFSKKACSGVLAKLVELGLVDDRRYAERLCEKLCESGHSKRSALQKMLLKGVPYDLAKELLSDAETDEVANILSLIEKKYASKLENADNFGKVYAALVRRGFSYGDVKTALKKYTEDLDFSEE